MSDKVELNTGYYVSGADTVGGADALDGTGKVDAAAAPTGVRKASNEDEYVQLSLGSDEKTLEEQLWEEQLRLIRLQDDLLSLRRQETYINLALVDLDPESDYYASLNSDLSTLRGSITTCNQEIGTCSLNISRLSVAVVQSKNAQTPNAPSTDVAGLPSPAVTSVDGVPYQGEKIPSDLAQRLDKKLGAGFTAKLESTAAVIGCNANDLVAMMYSESGLNPKAGNPNGGAIGLIQFMPSTLSGNGYSTSQIANMSAIQQLDVVADIMLKSKKMCGYSQSDQIDAGTLYAINFLPAVAKNEVLCSSSGKLSWAYSANSPLDLDKDGSITKSDLSKRLYAKYQEAYKYF